jgi:hypothetical protein
MENAMKNKLKKIWISLFLPLAMAGLAIPLETAAIVGAPLTPVSVGGVARRTTRRVVVASSASAASTASASTSAAQASAASAQASAAAASASAASAQATSQQAAAQQHAPATAPSPTQPAGAPAIGTIVPALPQGCAPVAVNGVEYQNCGGVYYRAAFQGNNLVYVVQQP